mmetsp:Transcript_8027/g.23988  ORF Transcript_8027/g.23988 Transcript_8027/m.23988 type:complete len:327 (-) Transcript_8027:16-996(-)
MPPKAKSAKAKKRKRTAADALTEVVDSLTCPITSALCVRPVVAEDGNIYERESIETWLAKKKKSPLTNEAMGTRLLDSATARKQIIAAIEGGSVDAEAAAAWHLGSARAMILGTLPGGTGAVGAGVRSTHSSPSVEPSPRAEGAASTRAPRRADPRVEGAPCVEGCEIAPSRRAPRTCVHVTEHLANANELCSSPETTRLLRAVELKAEVTKITEEGEDDEAIKALFGVDPPEGPKAPGPAMEAWLELREDQSIIRIIDDAEELEGILDEHADDLWEEGMGDLCGKEFKVYDMNEEDGDYYVLANEGEEDEEGFWIPFRGCILVKY